MKRSHGLSHERATSRGIRRGAAILVALTALAIASCGSVASAVETTYWRTDSYTGFLRGTAAGVAILESGRVVPGASMTALDVPDCDYVWSAAVGTRGEVYVTTGTPGSLCRADVSGGRVLLSMDDVDLPALAVGWGGDVFVGTAPGGEVYRVAPDGDSELFYETGENYIWAMAFSPEHGLIVGTGEAAVVIALDSDARARTLAQPTDLNIVTLVVDGERVFAGTGGDGLLLDVTPGGDARVLYDTRYDEVSGIVADTDGSLLFSASSISMEQALDEMADPSVPLGEGAVYRTTAGGAYEVWRSGEAPVVSLGRTPDGAVVAGMGSSGRVFAIEPGAHGLLADLDEAEALSIIAAEGGTIVTTGTPGGAYRLERGTSGEGSYESRVFDAVTSAIWGSCLVTADDAGHISVETRSGSIEHPDHSWSDWTSLEDGRVASPASRFLQWRATFDGGAGRETSLRAVEIAYLRENVPPQVVSVTVSEAGRGFSTNGLGNDTATQTLPSGLEVTYSMNAVERSAVGLPAVARGLRTVEWDAFDPNGDELTFDVYVRHEDESEWWLMEGDLDRPFHTWDSYSMPDGRYRIRIVASDRPGNPPTSAFDAEGTSGAFAIDNTPPTIGAIDLESGRDGATLTVSVDDASSPLAAVEVSVDYGEWERVHPGDGMYDGRSEEGRLVLSGLADGEHAVAVRAFDRPGNVGVRRVVLKS